MTDIALHLAADNIRQLRPYQPGKPVEELERELGITGAIKVASNENPLGPSPLAIEAAVRAAAEVHLYPDGGAFKLRNALAEREGVQPDELMFGAGSNELIYLLIRAFCFPGKHKVLAHRYSFISYRLGAICHNAPFIETEVTDTLACDVDAMLAAVDEHTRVVFLANPNNPTGLHVGTAEFERLLEGLPKDVVLVVDEAYHEYAVSSGLDYPRSQTYRSDEHPLVVTLRTFSKIYGMAGLRIGYGIAHPEVCDLVNRVRRPFNVGSVPQAAALAALHDEAHVRKSAEAARYGIGAMTEAVQKIGLTAYPSLSNFLLVGLGQEAEPVYETLLRQGVIVRPMRGWGLPEHIRISIGTQEQTARVVQALETIGVGSDT